uniref:Uncharacterized protein n=1 Tax=Anas platyrhynchos TaxID=8839 RepID=A0A8B9Z9S9_ANAPL
MQLGSLPASQAGAEPKSQLQHLSHPSPSSCAAGNSWLSPASTERWGRAGTRGPSPLRGAELHDPLGPPNLPPRGNPGQQQQLGLRKGAGCPPAAPFSPRAAPPHVLPPARQRGPCQPGAAGVRRQAHLQVHRGGQGHGEESGEEPLAPQNPVPGRAGHSSCPQTAALTSSAPTEPVPSSLGAQLPRDSAPGGCQNDAVENQIGEEGWEDGPGVPVGLEKDPRNQSKRREILCNLMLLLGAVRGAQSQESQECWAGQLNRLYRHAEAFLMLLKTWEPPQEEPWEPGCSPGSEERNTAVIFLAYQRLLQGKLRFFFYDLAKDLCNQGQGGGRDPPPRGLN